MDIINKTILYFVHTSHYDISLIKNKLLTLITLLGSPCLFSFAQAGDSHTPSSGENSKQQGSYVYKEMFPLHIAIANGDINKILDLTEAGADINIQDSRGLTPLYLEALEKNLDTASLLFAAGGDFNAQEFEAASNPSAYGSL